MGYKWSKSVQAAQAKLCAVIAASMPSGSMCSVNGLEFCGDCGDLHLEVQLVNGTEGTIRFRPIGGGYQLFSVGLPVQFGSGMWWYPRFMSPADPDWSAVLSEVCSRMTLPLGRVVH